MPLSNVSQDDLNSIRDQLKNYDLPTLLEIISGIGNGAAQDGSPAAPPVAPAKKLTPGTDYTPPAGTTGDDYNTDAAGLHARGIDQRFGQPVGDDVLNRILTAYGKNGKQNDFQGLMRARDEINSGVDSGTIRQVDADKTLKTDINPNLDRQKGLWDTSNIVFNRMKDKGLNPTDFGYVNNDNAGDQFPAQDPNVAGGDLRGLFDMLGSESNPAYGTAGADRIWSSLNSRYQSKNRGVVDAAFKPGKLENDTSDTMDDDIIGRIIDEQYAPAQERLDLSKKRGLLNDSGYGIAQDRLTKARGTVNAKLQGVGGGVIGTLKNRLGGIVGNAQTAASGSNLGDKFDFSGYQKQYDDAYNGGKSTLEGSIRQGITPDEFNVNDILGYARSNQGIDNNNPTDVASLLAQRRKRIGPNSGVGLGTEGAF